MSLPVALILSQDGLASGLIYGLLAISILLVFLVTRILWVAAGDLVVFSALTLASIAKGAVPGTIWLLGGLAAATFAAGAIQSVRTGNASKLPMLALSALVLPAIIIALTMYLVPMRVPLVGQVVLTLLLIVPIGSFIYRLAFQPIVSAPTLVLLFVALAVHYALTGLGLVFFGPDGYRTPPFIAGRVDIGITRVSLHLIIVIAATTITIAAFWYFFQKTLFGKVLRATAINRVGAELVGLWNERSGTLAFAIAAFISGLSGILIGPLSTLYYDSGFAISLKGFIGVVLGAMASFPVAALGALAVGWVEVFASLATSNYRDVIVFALLVPILLFRARTEGALHAEDGEE